jgi:ATPase family AAA domain-containing protein 3A/B
VVHHTSCLCRVGIDGFSGREIAKLAIAWQAAAFGSADATISVELMESVLASHLEQKERKHRWNMHHGVFEP